MATLLAGLPQSVPAITLNRLCASGLSAVNHAARAILCGDTKVAIAGGVESMSRAPWVLPKAQKGFPVGNLTAYDTSLGWRFPNPALAELFPLEGMGETAENLVEKYKISRSRQDEFALASHQKVWQVKRVAHSMLKLYQSRSLGGKQIQSYSTRMKDLADTSLARLAKLRAVFRSGGTVTAGNSSTLNDRSSAIVLCDRAFAEQRGLEILAVYRGSAAAGVNPRYMGIGPVPATEKVLKRCDTSVEYLDWIELNEAFAAQSIAVIDELGLNEANVNPLGGAIALGHPLGCSGARILTTLIHGLRQRGGGRGLAALCVGVGQGVATLIECP